MDPIVAAFAQWGPLGLIAGLLWFDNQKGRAQSREDAKAQHDENRETNGKMLDVLTQNAGAMQSMADASKATTAAIDRLTAAQDRVTTCLVRLEEQHRAEGK